MADEIERNPNDAVILSYSQNPVEYQNVPKVWLTHPDSTEENPVLVPFTYGEAVSKEVTPDWSGGDMVVTPEEGKVFSYVNIPKPANLLPENIAEGVNIGGIIGTMVAGGSGGNIRWASGVVQGTGSQLVIEHGLGVKPDIMCVAADKKDSATYRVYSGLYMRSELYSENTGSYIQLGHYWGNNFFQIDKSYGYFKVTEESGTVGSSSLVTPTTAKYYWFAITGLV